MGVYVQIKKTIVPWFFLVKVGPRPRPGMKRVWQDCTLSPQIIIILISCIIIKLFNKRQNENHPS
jgi:hypothetical protein